MDVRGLERRGEPRRLVGRGQGIGRGEGVALLMENRPEFLASWMGLAKLGAVTALINTNLTGKALRHALARVEGART